LLTKSVVGISHISLGLAEALVQLVGSQWALHAGVSTCPHRESVACVLLKVFKRLPHIVTFISFLLHLFAISNIFLQKAFDPECFLACWHWECICREGKLLELGGVHRSDAFTIAHLIVGAL
jgi:hypothetical protein